MKRTRVVAFALVSVLAAGCGGSGGQEPAAAPTTTAPAVRSAAEEAAAAERALLRAADLPGYRQGASTQVSPYATVYSTCTGNPLLPGGPSTGGAGQAPFVNDETAAVRAVQTTSVSSFAVFAENEADARRTLADLAKPDVAPCVGNALLAEVNNLTSPRGRAEAQTSAALPSLSVGDESAGLRTTVAGTVPQHFDLTVARKGRALTFLLVSRLGRSPFPEADRRRLADLLVSRIA